MVFLKISLKFFFRSKNSARIWFWESLRWRHFLRSFCQRGFTANSFSTWSGAPKFYISHILYGFYEDAVWRIEQTQLSFATNLIKYFACRWKIFYEFLNFFINFECQQKILKFTTMLAICSRIYSNICVTVIRNWESRLDND